MAQIKLYKKGNYIFLEEEGVLHEGKADEVMITKQSVSATDYTIDLGQGKRILNQPLADILDASGVAYADAQAFEDFYTTSTGSGAGSGDDGSASSGASTQAFSPSTSIQTIATADSLRKGGSMINNSNQDAYILLGSGTVSSSFFTIELKANKVGYYEFPYGFSGTVTAIFPHTGSGELLITKYS
jgi:hypothetical protein